MTIISELTEIEKWLYATLKNSSDIAAAAPNLETRISPDPAPPKTAFPLITFANLTAVDLLGVGPTRIWADTVYRVKGIIQGEDVLPLAPVEVAIDQTLNFKSGETSVASIVSCVRIAAFKLVEAAAPDGRMYIHLGGDYRIRARPKS